MQKMTIRAGYGIFFTQDTGNPVFDMARNLGFRESARSLDLLPTSNIEAPWDVKAGGGDTGCSNWDGLCLGGLYTFSNDVGRRTPYIQQYLFNVQYQLTDTLLVEVGYQGNKGTKFQRMFGWNDPTPQEYYKRATPEQRASTASWATAISCNVPDATGKNELTYRQGNIARNMYLRPGVFGWDFSAMKNFRMTERVTFQFRFESFNFPHKVNWERRITTGTPPTMA